MARLRLKGRGYHPSTTKATVGLTVKCATTIKEIVPWY